MSSIVYDYQSNKLFVSQTSLNKLEEIDYIKIINEENIQ